MVKRIMWRRCALLVTCGLLLGIPHRLAGAEVWVVHDDEGPMRVLAEILVAAGHTVVVEEQDAFRKRMKSPPPAAIFMYVHGDLADDVTEYLITYAKRGGRLIVLHHGLASGKAKNERWMEFLGVKIFPRNDPVFPWKVLRGTFELVNLAPDHYVTSHRVSYPARVRYRPSDAPSTEQELPAITLPATEVFLNQVFTDGRRKRVLFGFRIEVGGRVYMQDRAGWVMPAGEGQVFYFQPGHRAEDFRNPGYAQILLNAVEME